MKLIEQKANELATAVAVQRGISKFDPTIVMLIIQAIVEMVKMWQDCRKSPSEALDTAKKPGILSRFVIGRVMKRHLGKAYDDDFRQELTDMASTMSLGEMKTLYAEVKAAQ